MKSKSVVITTINYPSDAIRQIADEYSDWNLIVIGDKKTPADWSYGKTDYLSVDQQLALP